MSKKSVIIFLSIFLISYAILEGLFHFVDHRGKKHHEQQIALIHESIKDRFKVFLSSPLTISLVGAKYFARGDLKTGDYAIFSADVLNHNSEILGLTVIAADGRIVRVFPEKENLNTLGKMTQNISYLLKSYEKKEPYWLSPPFKLYQGEKGFAFYSPIITDQKLSGWFTTVISSERFFEHFRLAEYLEFYELVIKDSATGESYFASAIEENSRGRVSKMVIENRELIFISWPKTSEDLPVVPLYVSLLFCLLLAVLVSAINHLAELRKKSHDQMNEIRSVLRMTAREAIGKLIDLRTERKNDHKEITYLTNLVEQIDLLQTMSNPESKVKEESYELLPLVQNELNDMMEVLSKKNIKVIFDIKTMKQLTVIVNARLVQSGVLHHVLVHLLVHTRENSTLEISHKELSHSYELVFHSYHISGPDAFQTDRRFEVAVKVMHIIGGSLVMENADSHGMLIKLSFPVKVRVDRTKES